MLPYEDLMLHSYFNFYSNVPISQARSIRDSPSTSVRYTTIQQDYITVIIVAPSLLIVVVVILAGLAFWKKATIMTIFRRKR